MVKKGVVMVMLLRRVLNEKTATVLRFFLQNIEKVGRGGL